jgi:hypothetical protein
MSTTTETIAATDTAALKLPQTVGELPALNEDDAGVERELKQLEDSASTLHREGQIADNDLQDTRAQVERTRTAFRNLPPDVRARIIKRRRDFDVRLTQRQLPGASVVDVEARINHTRLKPLFEQWWPFINRMSINLVRFGSDTFEKKAESTLNKWLEDRLTKLETIVCEDLNAAQAFREMKVKEMQAKNQHILELSVMRPSMVLPVEAYTRFSHRVLRVIMDFDTVLDNFDFIVWNGIRNGSDTEASVKGLGNGGVVALTIDDAGPALTQMVSDLLLACYGSRFTVEIRNQKALASGELREGFEILVHDAEIDSTKEVSVMSGGQRVWINECLVRGIVLYTERTDGQPYKTLFTDETDGPLDPEKKRQFMRMKREVFRLSGIDREFFISHTPELVAEADAVIDAEAMAA